ncbi:MAG: aldo/keto reductase [Hyphomicrobiales bacterium]|nr:aldo/keto reductase [Hyphomicrobiales bacterium]
MIDVDKMQLVRRVGSDAFQVPPSSLGFGCASLGSRISGKKGLGALEDAFDRGVVWFDIAPAYGAASAEEWLGRFLPGRRENLLLTTKVGIVPPKRLGAMKLAYSVGRPFLAKVGVARRAFRRSGATRNVRKPLTAALVETSIGASLRRLRVDHVDVYALHDPMPEDVMREDIVRALERVLTRGQARAVAVAGSYDACRAALDDGLPYKVMQMCARDVAVHGSEFVRRGRFLVTHSVFGVGGEADHLAALLRRDRARLAGLVAQGYACEPQRAAAGLLLDAALASNPSGVVLASMFDARRREENIERAGRLPRMDAPSILADILGPHALSSSVAEDAASCG